ncbi:MAG: hypothetical protein ACREUB_01425 [Burkholderiales bacterium]
MLALAYGCGSTPKEFVQPTPETAANREAQTRRFRDVGEEALLVACISVMQDLGYRVTATDLQLGVVTGARQRPIGDWLSDLFPMALSAGITLGLHPREAGMGPPTGFRILLTTRSVGGEPRVHDVRVTFYRTWFILDVQGTEQWMRGALPITAPVLYQNFFAMLDATLARSRSGK